MRDERICDFNVNAILLRVHAGIIHGMAMTSHRSAF